MKNFLLPVVVVAGVGLHGVCGDIIKSISIKGNTRQENIKIKNLFGFDVGADVSSHDLSKSLKKIYASGYFSDVNIDMESGHLTIHVQEHPVINQITFEGNHEKSKDILEADMQLKPRQVLSAGAVQEAVNRMLMAYRRDGYFATHITPKIIRRPQNRVDVVFDIQEGTITHITKILFLGNNNFTDSTLKSALLSREFSWYSFLSGTDFYDPARLEQDRYQLRQFYLNEGYPNFKILSTIVEMAQDKSGFFITFKVDEGQRYTFGDIKVQSELAKIDAHALKKDIIGSHGHWYSERDIEKAKEVLSKELGDRGYIFVEPEAVKTLDDKTKRLSVTYVLKESRQAFIERIEIVGNRKTQDHVIRRELRLHEGDAVNMSKIQRSLNRVRGLGFFDNVTVEREPGTTKDRVVFKIVVKERENTAEVSGNGGYTTGAAGGLFGQVSYKQRNIFGSGRSLSVEGYLARSQKIASLSVEEPYLFGYDLDSTFQLFTRDTDFTTNGNAAAMSNLFVRSFNAYKETSAGGTVSVGVPLTEHLRQNVTMTLKSSDFDRRRDDALINAYVDINKLDYQLLSLGTGLSYEDTDNRFMPSSGYYATMGGDIGKGLGSKSQDVNFIRLRVGAGLYVPLNKDQDVVFSMKLRGGAIMGFDRDWDRSIVIGSERFELGGDNLRGFRYMGVGPRYHSLDASDPSAGETLGGEMYYLGTASLKFPIGLPPELGIKMGVFMDVGDVFGLTPRKSLYLAQPQRSYYNEVFPRVSIGFGVHWHGFLGPVFIGFGFPLRTTPYDQHQSLFFGPSQ